MTPASALSRLEKLAEEYWIHCPLPAKGSENYANEVRSAFNAGGKAMLQILSEPGEACGPRVKIHPNQLSRLEDGLDAVASPEDFDCENHEAPHCLVYVSEAELLQARAAHAIELEQIEGELRREQTRREELQFDFDAKRSLAIALVNEKEKTLGREQEISRIADKLRAALASSEARVRILSDALEKIAELQGSPIKSSAGWAGQVARQARTSARKPRR